MSAYTITISVKILLGIYTIEIFKGEKKRNKKKDIDS